MAIQEYPKKINSPTAGRITVHNKAEEEFHLGEQPEAKSKEVAKKDAKKSAPWGAAS